jgi:hypothetical protein
MDVKTSAENKVEKKVTVDEVNRVLELGSLLLSVLTPEEIAKLQDLPYDEVISDSLHDEIKIGNIGVT